MSTVAVEEVAKRYGRIRALDGVSALFGEREFFGLLGPSGSGKTTLLRAIAGFVEPDSGTIRIDGVDMARVPVHRRDIGMVFQNYALFPHLTVFENIAFGLEVRGQKPAETVPRVARMLELVRLAGFESRRPRQLSGGQQQRVALARALVTNPRVLLLDEPLGALDKRLRQEMQIELKQIQREVGITTIFVTHDQEEALTLSDRIAIFSEGKIVQIGAPREVYERPRTAFAANFLGDANFFTGTAEARAGGLTAVATAEGRLITSAPVESGNMTVTLAVRPEKIAIDPAEETARDGETPVNRLTGRVRQSVYAGSSVTYKVEVGARLVTVFVQTRNQADVEPGARVDLVWSASDSVPVEP